MGSGDNIRVGGGTGFQADNGRKYSGRQLFVLQMEDYGLTARGRIRGNYGETGSVGRSK